MTGFEIKKIFSKNSNKIALLILAVVLAVVCFNTVRAPEVTFVNSQGQTEHGIDAARSLREVKKGWSGMLTEEKISKVIVENNRINGTKEALSENIEDQEKAYNRKQGFLDIHSMLGDSFSFIGQYDYYRPDSLKPDDAESFYYDYAGGWKQVIDYTPMLMVIMTLIISFIVSGIFPGEFSTGAASVFFASKHGRGKAIRAKIKAGLMVVSAVYGVVLLIFTIVVLCCLGFDGGSCPIQTAFGYWYSFYNITLWQTYDLIAIGGYIGTVAVAVIVMLVSAKTRSAVVPVVAFFVLVLMPSYIPDDTYNIITKAAGLLPDQLLQLSFVFQKLTMYSFGESITGAANVLPIIYFVFIVIMCPVLYLSYRKVDVK